MAAWLLSCMAARLHGRKSVAAGPRASACCCVMLLRSPRTTCRPLLPTGRRNVLNDLKRVVAQEAYEYR